MVRCWTAADDWRAIVVDGTVERIGKLKREDAARQAMARAVLSNLKLSGDPRAYHFD
jgi:hypothetical protein